MTALPAQKYLYQQPDSANRQIMRKALIRLIERLAISRREIAAIIGISEASISRFYEGKRFIEPTSKEGELALLLLRLYRSLDTLLGGNEKQCQLWFRSYNTHLNGTPVELAQSIQGLVTITYYLDAMRGKV